MRQLEIEEEVKVRQLIRERDSIAKDKAFERVKKEESKERKDEFKKIDFVRHDHYDKVQKFYKNLDNIAHKAG
jgi:hypothetical protein